jgi:hypothetical protein
MPINYVNLPEWNGHAKHLTDVWRLHKGDRQALCTLSTHPIGGEIRVEVNGELLRSQAGRKGTELMDLAFEWKSQFVLKGWTP